MKPLMMMRTKGVTGPMISKHTGCSRLCKSTGNAHIPGHNSARVVPDVVGLSEAAAIAAIEAEDLVARDVGNPGVTVQIQNPEPGIGVREGSTVSYRLA